MRIVCAEPQHACARVEGRPSQPYAMAARRYPAVETPTRVRETSTGAYGSWSADEEDDYEDSESLNDDYYASDDEIDDDFYPYPDLAPDAISPDVLESMTNFALETFLFNSASTDPHDNSAPQRPAPVLACPYYIHSPAQHRRCLSHTIAHVRTLRDLKRHLLASHRRPYYCPLCFTPFRLAAERDAHIRERNPSRCRRRDTDLAAAVPGGLSETQARELGRKPRPWETEALQWLSVWQLLFPGVQPPPSPYLRVDVALRERLDAARGFWSANGDVVMREFVARAVTSRTCRQRGGRGSGGRGDLQVEFAVASEGDWTAVKNGVLGGMLEKLVLG